MIIGSSLSLNAQQELSWDQYLTLVLQQNPMAQRAELIQESGIARLLEARGGFDPKFDFDYNHKDFEGTHYYGLLDGAIKVPTPFAVELKGGYERNRGIYRGEQNTVPDAGLIYAGLTAPLGEGLFMDERRFKLQKAKLGVELARQEQIIALNDLLYQASAVYFEWFKAQSLLALYNEGLELARFRVRGIRASVQQGDRAAIDTVEANLQIQLRELDVQSAEIDLQIQENLLTTFLWQDSQPAAQLISTAVPAVSAQEYRDSLGVWNMELLTNHPKLRKLAIKQRQLEFEQRWKKEQLKPTVDLVYNVLHEPINENGVSDINFRNFKGGVVFQSSLLLRKERAGVRLAELKLRDNDLDRVFTQQDLMQKATQYRVQVELMQEQLVRAQTLADNYQRMLDGERMRFENGESSLFLINTREQSYLNAREKVIETAIKLLKAKAAYYWATVTFRQLPQ